MVIGNGMVAKAFDDYRLDDDIVIFASGVSNSKTTDQSLYRREIQLLESTYEDFPGKKLVYFSTCSLYDPAEKGNAYCLHKKKIEDLIQQKVKRYNIFRVSNLVGKSENKNTLLNFFFHHISHSINFDLWKGAWRNILDVDDMVAIVNEILQEQAFENRVVNIANPSNDKVENIVRVFESLLGKKANAIAIDRGSNFNIDIEPLFRIIDDLAIPFGEKYLETLIRKYYLSR